MNLKQKYEGSGWYIPPNLLAYEETFCPKPLPSFYLGGAMREIKFRAWDKELKAIRTVDTIHFGLGTGYGKVSYSEDNFDTNYQGQFKAPNKKNIDCILMQYTGLKDKEGVEIYEGDIVRYDGDEYNKDIEEEVEFKGGAFYPVCNFPVEEVNIEVIGNIYENKSRLT